MKKICLLLVISLLLLTSCYDSLEGIQAYKYPDWFTREYCLENYVLADPNLMYLYCYNSAKSITVPYITNYFAAIKDVELDSFISLIQYIVLWGSSYNVSVVRKKDCKIDPIHDWTVSKIEMFLRNSGSLVIPDHHEEDSSLKDGVIKKYRNMNCTPKVRHVI